MKLATLRKSLFALIFFLVLLSCSEDEQFIEFQVQSEQSRLDIKEVIQEWNTLWLQLDRYAKGMRPNATARALAYIHLAGYETAVYTMDGYVSTSERLSELEIDQSRRAGSVQLEMALNSCYARVINHFMQNIPANERAKIEALEDAKMQELGADIPSNIIQRSREWGRYVASQVIRYSRTDITAEEQILEPQPLSYEPPTGEGYWTYSAEEERALFPYWSSVRTFVITPQETTSVTPMLYSHNIDSPYYEQMMEVYETNNTAREEDNEDLWIAEYWSDDVEGLMMSPPSRQISIASQLIEQYELEYEQSLELLLKLGFALNDAAVSTWADKYEYMVMRPSVYIQEQIDPEYETNLFRLIFWPNPTFPGYPSGHSAFASASAGVFIDQFGDATDFTDRSHEGRTEFRGMPRTFSSFSQMASENGYSRIPLGVHIRMDCDEGLRLGYEVSDAVNSFSLKKSFSN